ncbi:GroES-like protein [Mollisia scopiformis]|uniref:GroES-like protein n=1 Tax=Mollisia scopiformis TaxID=149040 RepID=A0A194WZF2_MOLSC|nr:GroES-like protein [Mollisia scopiformis]KUJ12982.1 GroES-like protein [Mollisia scopiformis]
MKAINVRDGTGPAEALFFDEVPDPELEGDDILVRIKVFGVNRADLMQRAGTYPMLPEYGAIMGLEFSGIVEAKGPEASDAFKVGDNVFGLAFGGTMSAFCLYAEKVATSEKTLIHLPKELSWERAASLPEVFMTSVQDLRLIANFKAGEDILIHAGASGVGLATIQISKLLGANKIFVTAGSDEKCRLCLSLEATSAVNYRTTDFTSVVTQETNGKGVDMILDMVQRRRISILTTQLRSSGKVYQGKVRDLFREEVLPGIVKGEIKTFVDGVYSWKEIVEVHKRLEDSKTSGKMVCIVD